MPARLGVDRLAVLKSQGRPASLTPDMSCALLLPLSLLARNLLIGGNKDLRKFGLLRGRGFTKTKTVIVHDLDFALGCL